MEEGKGRRGGNEEGEGRMEEGQREREGGTGGVGKVEGVLKLYLKMPDAMWPGDLMESWPVNELVRKVLVAAMTRSAGGADWLAGCNGDR